MDPWILCSHGHGNNRPLTTGTFHEKQWTNNSLDLRNLILTETNWKWEHWPSMERNTSEMDIIAYTWIHCWNNWHWTLSFSWIWSYWISLGKCKMADISKSRNIWETWKTVLHSTLHSRHFGVPQAMFKNVLLWRTFLPLPIFDLKGQTEVKRS